MDIIFEEYWSCQDDGQRLNNLWVKKDKVDRKKKKKSWGGIVEGSLQTISNSKSVLKIFVFIF